VVGKPSMASPCMANKRIEATCEEYTTVPDKIFFAQQWEDAGGWFGFQSDCHPASTQSMYRNSFEHNSMWAKFSNERWCASSAFVPDCS